MIAEADLVAAIQGGIESIEAVLAQAEAEKDDAVWRLTADELPDGVARLTELEVLDSWAEIDMRIAKPRMKLATLRASLR